MARDPPPKGVPRKKKEIHPPTGGFPDEESSDDGEELFAALDRERRYDEKQRLLAEEKRLADERSDVAAAEQRSLLESEGDNPEEPEDEEDVDMNEPAPDRDGRAVVIPWYETVLDTSEEVAKSLYDDQDLKTPAHWASLNDKSIDAMAKQGKTPIPIRLFDRLKLLAFTCRHAERTSRPHTYLTGIDEQSFDDLREQKEE
jgi:hypothetical protein